MSLLCGRCVICTSVFASNKISALHCGHTFHFTCISKWVERSKTCPICRVKTSGSQIIRQIYFDSADDIAASQAQDTRFAQIEALSIALEKEKTDYLQTHEELQKMKSSLAIIEEKLEREMKNYREKLPSLQARNRQLEMMLVDQQELESAIKKMRSRLHACEFYNAVTTGKDETAMDKYIKEDGGVEIGQFLIILRRQLDDARKSQIKLKDEVSTQKELLRKSMRKENDLKNIISALEKELRDVRVAANMSLSTPLNPKLYASVKKLSPSKRGSLGFDDTFVVDEEVHATALRNRWSKVPSFTRRCVRKISEPNSASTSHNEDTAFPQSDVSLLCQRHADELPNPRIPKTMLERVCADFDEHDDAEA